MSKSNNLNINKNNELEFINIYNNSSLLNDVVQFINESTKKNCITKIEDNHIIVTYKDKRIYLCGFGDVNNLGEEDNKRVQGSDIKKAYKGKCDLVAVYSVENKGPNDYVYVLWQFNELHEAAKKINPGFKIKLSEICDALCIENSLKYRKSPSKYKYTIMNYISFIGYCSKS